jgi:lipoprotein-anchoring transpeptidase ErfK/SrfK
MFQRRPELAKFANGLPGGRPDNPLGARALYLFDHGRDTLFRIHGTNEPKSIGTAASSGCIRMLNEEVIELYDRVPIGTKVIVL